MKKTMGHCINILNKDVPVCMCELVDLAFIQHHRKQEVE